jgi:hypothetical protein
MKDIKRKLRYTVNISLMIALIFMSVCIGQAAVSADRTIDNNTLMAGSGTIVTVVIQNDIIQAIDLQETIPPGFVLTKISDDANQFKSSTNEWIWITVANNATKTVKYKITVPSGAVAGTYDIKGTILTNGNTTSVTGDGIITVTNPTSMGSSGSGSSSGSDTGTYPAVTTKAENATVAAPIDTTVSPAVTSQPIATAVEQTVQPLETASDTPVTTTKKSSGFEIVIAIGIFGSIYMLRKRK